MSEKKEYFIAMAGTTPLSAFEAAVNQMAVKTVGLPFLFESVQECYESHAEFCNMSKEFFIQGRLMKVTVEFVPMPKEGELK